MPTVIIHGQQCKLPAEYKPHYDEGVKAGNGYSRDIPSNPYQAEYTATGDKDALWKAVAWFAGFRSTVPKLTLARA